ncbi:hypothetical protein [Pseudomonas farris]
MAASPDVLISQKAISVNVGSHRQAIKDYLAIASEALATPTVCGCTGCLHGRC